MASKKSASRLPYDLQKFENDHQVAGIQTALIDYPNPGGMPGAGGRVAMISTGTGLRFTVALDRGGDIVEAFFNQHSLAFLSANGPRPANPAYHVGAQWLTGWRGGLLTTCGPQYIGQPRQEDDQTVSLHGRYSNTPAAVESLVQPDLRAGRDLILLSLIVRDSCVFGPNIQIRRTIQTHVGSNEIHLSDQIVNYGNTPTAHNWLYHCNLGYPLLDKGSRVIMGGKLHSTWGLDEKTSSNASALEKLKIVPDPLPQHAGVEKSRGLILDSLVTADGLAHVGLINDRLSLGVELAFSPTCLPRLANWQQYGPAGVYVMGIEPFNGSLSGKAKDQHPLASQTLKPGQSKNYDLTLRVLTDKTSLASLRKHDRKISV